MHLHSNIQLHDFYETMLKCKNWPLATSLFQSSPLHAAPIIPTAGGFQYTAESLNDPVSFGVIHGRPYRVSQQQYAHFGEEFGTKLWPAIGSQIDSRQHVGTY